MIAGQTSIQLREGELSAAILAKNESANLADCLDSLGWVPQVVVVDSGSTDGTRELAAELGVEVLVRPLDPFNVVDQRNWVLDHPDISGRWILFLDADERATPALAEQIVQAIREPNENTVGYSLCFRLMFMGRWLKHAQRFPTWIDRLADRRRVRFMGDVADQTWERFDAPPQTIGRVDEPFVHCAFANGIDRWMHKHLRYADLWAMEIRREDQSTRLVDLLLGNKRARGRTLQRIAHKTLLLSPELRFLYMALWSGGLLDGVPGIVFCKMLYCYQFMIHLKVIEREFRDRRRRL